jgi:polyisoprenoid-binding protein YceI
MARWPYTDEELRSMYAGGRGNATARRYARLWAAVLGTGLLPRRWVTLEVAGRRTGRPTRFPLGMADWHGNWYLVSMLGNDCHWVRNVRAAGGHATLRHGRARACRLVEVPATDRAPILKRYLRKVPGARPHIPVALDAPLAEYEAVAARYPAFRVEYGGHAPIPATPRRRHWLRWTLGGIAALVVLLLAAAAVAVKLQPTPAPLALPPNPAAPTGPVDGTWQVAPGSVAGFRIQQTVLLLTSEVVGRTNDITGTVTVVSGRATAADVHINLLALTTADRKPAPQFGISLDTTQYPTAAVTLAQPVPLDAALSRNAVTVVATGTLTLHGVTRTVTVSLALRRDGANLDIAGQTPVAFKDYSLASPTGYGPIGSLADHGVAEFLLILHRT